MVVSSSVLRLTAVRTARDDDPEPDPRECPISRPIGVLVDGRDVLYVPHSDCGLRRGA